MQPQSMFKTLPLLVLVAIGSLTSCDKVRTMVGQLGEKKAAATTTAGARVSEIPKGVSEVFPVETRRIIVIDYYADWCGPCRMLSPMLEKIAEDHTSTLLVCKVNVDKFRELATQEGIKSIPDVRIFVDGKLVDQFVGAPSEAEVRKRIEVHALHLPPLPEADVAPKKPKETIIRPMTKDWMPPGIQRR